LLQEHGIADEFKCPADASIEVLVKALLERLGRLRGIIPGGLEHQCLECTHEKRYLVDLVAEGINLNKPADSVAGIESMQEVYCFFTLSVQYINQ